MYAMNNRASKNWLMMSTMLVGLGVIGFGNDSFAGVCAGGLNVWTCSGPAALDTEQNLSAAPITVTTISGFGIDTTATAGNAFTLTGTIGLTFTDEFASAISGNKNGIEATNHGGAGTLAITATGIVTGTNQDGILATNYGVDQIINVVDVSGGRNGILSTNFSQGGSLSITATGTVTGTSTDGINASNNVAGTSLTISAVDVSGGQDGIYASNDGAGLLSITSTGLVEGTTGYGIYAINDGTGVLAVTSTGMVSGTSVDGIFANTRALASGLTVNAASAFGAQDGIDARNEGTGGGALAITVTGTVAGTSGYGIKAINPANGTDLTITLEDGAIAEGGTSGIYAEFAGSGVFGIDNSGTIRNLSGLSSDLALQTSTGVATGVELANMTGGTVVGLLNLSPEDDTFENAGLWENTGNSDFSDGMDVLTNLTGGQIRVANSGAAQTTTWIGLESFENAGLLTFADGFAGDILINPGDYVGAGGSIEFDAVLNGTGSAADRFEITGAVSGSGTTVSVNNIGGTGVMTGTGAGVGIALIDVTASGTTSAGDFALAGPVSAGVFRYDLNLETDNIWYLQSTSFSDPTFIYPALPSTAYALGRDMIGTLADRSGLQGRWGPGAENQTFWLRAGGSWIDAEATIGLLGGNENASYDSNQQFAQGGVNLGFHDSASGKMIGSVFAQIGQAETLAFNSNSDLAGKINLTSYGAGMALTWYGVGGLYVDLQGQASFYNANVMDTALETLGDPNGWGLGASVEAGYALPMGDSARFVPQAQLVWQKISLGDFTDATNSAVSWNDNGTLEGHFGVAVETEHAVGDAGNRVSALAEANLVHQFRQPGGLSYGGTNLEYDMAKTNVVLGLGANFDIGGPNSVNVYVKGDYSIPVGDGAAVTKAKIGVKYIW